MVKTITPIANLHACSRSWSIGAFPLQFQEQIQLRSICNIVVLVRWPLEIRRHGKADRNQPHITIFNIAPFKSSSMRLQWERID